MFIPDTEQPKPITEPVVGGSFIPDTPLPAAGVGGTLAEFGKGIVRGAMNVGAGITGTLGTFAAAKTAPFRGFAPPEEMLPPVKERAEPFFEAKKRIKVAKEAFPVTHRGAGAWAGRVLGEAIPYMGAALAGGYLAGPAGAAMVGFSVEGDNAYDEAIAHGASEEKAQTERVIVGSINAAIEALQISQLMKFHATGKNTLKNFIKLAKAKAWKLVGTEAKNFTSNTLKLAISEAAEEFLQEGVSISVPAALRKDYPKKPDGSPDLWAIGQRLGEAALGGGFAGAVLGAGGAMVATTPYLATPTDIELSNAIERTQKSKLPKAKKERMIRDFEALRVELGAEPTVTVPEAKGVPAAKIPAESDIILAKLKKGIEEAEIKRPGEEVAISQERGKRLGDYEELLKAESNPRIASHIAKRALAGAMKVEVEALENRFSEEEINSLYERVRSATILAGTRLNVFEGLEKILFEGQIPARHEVEAIEEVFGVDIAKALMEKRRQAGKDGWDRIMDAINIPRALLASYDLSASGRQGILLLPLVPKEWFKALGRGYRALANPKYAKFVDLQIKTNPYYEKLSKSGVDLTRVGGMTSGEEVFISDFADKIPGVSASERAYVTTLNSLRAGTFYHFAEQWEGSGKTDADYKSLAAFINHATGRGDIKGLKKYYPVLNAAFFAPRLQMGRVQVLADLFTATSPILKLIVADLLEFVGGGLLVLTLLNLLRGVDVEPDPRSTDFGKIKIGNTRIDFWGGYDQIARFVVQLIQAERKATETGRIMPVERGDVVWRFIQSKLSPPAGLTVDMIRGETYLGKQLELEPGVVNREVFERFVPLFTQDLIDAIRFQGLGTATLIAPLGLHGIGTMTYPVRASSDATRLKDTYAQKYFGQSWDDIGPDAQTALKEFRPQITLKEEEARMEREDFDFMAKVAEEQRKSAEKVKRGLPRNIQKELDNLTVDVKGLSRHIASNWYLNDKRYKQYQNNTIKILNTVLPKMIGNPVWNKLDFETKREIMRTLIDDAKKAVRDNIVQEATIQDIEQLRGSIRGSTRK